MQLKAISLRLCPIYVFIPYLIHGYLGYFFTTYAQHQHQHCTFIFWQHHGIHVWIFAKPFFNQSIYTICSPSYKGKNMIDFYSMQYIPKEFTLSLRPFCLVVCIHQKWSMTRNKLFIQISMNLDLTSKTPCLTRTWGQRIMR